MKAYNLEGCKGLKDNVRGVKSEDKKLLSKNQEKEIQQMIVDVMPNQLKLNSALWITLNYIAKDIVAHKSTVSRKVKRISGKFGTYNPQKANIYAEERKRKV